MRSEGVLSHYSAAALWGFIEWDGRSPEVLVIAESSRARPGLKVRRTAALERKDIKRHRGVSVTSPARTLLDLAAVLDYQPLRRTVRRAQALNHVNVPQIVEVLNRLGARAGAPKLRRVVAKGPAPTRTELEDVVLDLIVRGGLAHPQVNVPLTLDGRRIVPDFRWPAQRLVVEADGAASHDNDVARENDAERQAVLEAHGEQVLRVTWRQAISSPAQTIDRIRSAGAPRGRPGAGLSA